MKPERYHRMIAVVTVMASTACGVVVNDFGRYEIILQRRPFGEAPAASEVNVVRKAPVVPAGPSFVDSLTMCAITSGGGAVRVGFLDGKARPPKTYFLFVGESEDGIQVVSADYEAESVTLEKDGDTRVLSMSTASAAAPQAAHAGASLSRERRGIKSSRGHVLSPGRKLRIEERKRRSLQKPNLQGAMLDAYQRKYNMEVIRQGAPPLPIPLTPAEDATLVAEGVLPPQAE
jgi:hypothetical protein